jgi:pimeloyl-ACP methyl ester carboxylesterase
VAAIEWGADGARPVLALHGWLDNAASFARLATLLDRLHLVAIDLPGHGRSETPPAACARHFVDWVPVVLDVAEALGWQRFSLMGHSMGAGIATLVPAVARDRIERLVLLEGMGPLSSSPDDAPEQLAKALRSEAAVTRAEPNVYRDFDAAVTARMKNSDLDRASARLLVERGVEFEKASSVKEVVDKVDVLYVTRLQEERFPSKEDAKNSCKCACFHCGHG